ncbi:serine/threonine protein kinase [Haloactinospora alba]|uniref:Serine/threonine protein kinase n=1 Tax=Haloactinospora alba TaxID=405555 RepID=A0A543NH85_9ACTN|nr:serine/threonine-protein kinase [Haloactinospora alba]TQN31215.1 serine/threonine protein kinase [Haloactinospora alba]
MPEGRPLLPGDPHSIGGYRITGRLGKGGQGVVYLGAAPNGQAVAVKVLDPDWAADPGLRQRFQREAAAARRVASFCTAQVLDADFVSEQPYIVSEYVDGPSLKEQVEQHGPRSGAELHRLAVATMTALVAVHEAGIVHRDVKPANVLMAAEGPRVIDFGVAKATDVTTAQTQSVVGTPGYMAPEQIAGGEVGPATDIYAWGAVMVFAATGRAPFTGDSVPAVIHQVMTTTPDLAQLEEPWASLVETCLAKEASQRPSSADLLMRLLGRDDGGGRVPPPADGASSDVPADSGPTTVRSRRSGKRSGRRAAVLGSALALLAAVGTSGYVALADTGVPFFGSSEDTSQAGSPASSPSGSAGRESPDDGGTASPTQPEEQKTGEDDPSDGAEAGTQAEAETEAKEERQEQKEQEDGEDEPPAPEEAEEKNDDVTFSSEFAGTWVSQGTFPDGQRHGYKVSIAEGERKASVLTDNGPCTWNFTLFRTNNKSGYDGSVDTTSSCTPHKGGGFWIDGGRLVVMLWGEEGNFQEHFFWFDRQ